MPSGVTQPTAPPRAVAAPAAGPATVTTAVLLATVPTAQGGPAAPLDGPGQGTRLSRLAGQLAATGIADGRVICRPGHEHGMAEAMRSGRAAVRVLVSPDAAGDLRAIADIANEAGGGLGVLAAESIVHQQALTGLLTDPRSPT